MPVLGLASKNLLCSLPHHLVSYKLAEQMDEVVESKGILGESGTIQWKRSAGGYVAEIEQLYTVREII